MNANPPSAGDSAHAGSTTLSRDFARQTERLVEETSFVTGQAFLDRVVQRLSEALGVKYLFVGEVIGHGTRVRSLARAVDGALADGIEYPLAGTPCERVIGHDALFIERNAAALFPADVALVRLGIESYFGFPIVDGGGAPLGIVVALHNQPLAANETVRTWFQLFAARAGAEITRMRHDRERATSLRFEAMGMIAAGVAHDFNNILCSMLANAELARESAEGGSAELLDDIIATAEMGRRMLNRIREYSVAGGATRSPDVDLAALAKDACRTLAPLAASGVQLECTIDASTPAITAAREEIQQVVLNLVTNAMQAVESAGGTVAITSRVAQAADLAACDAPTNRTYVALEVRDTGPGIAPELLPRVFEPFYSTRRGRGGTGLGLAMVQRVVKAHGGFIHARSAVGEGAVFTVVLPAEHAPAGERRAAG